MLLGVGQHEARAVHAEHRVGGAHDLVQRILDPHVPEAELAEFSQSRVYVVQGDVVHLIASS